MVPILAFVAGVAVGVAVYKLYDILKNDTDTHDAIHIEQTQPRTDKHVAPLPVEKNSADTSKLDISPLEPIMEQYGVDITAANCLYILCNKIKSSTYKRLLYDIIEKTRTGEDLISFIKNVHIETFSFPDSPTGRFFVPISTINQLLSASAISSDKSNPRANVEILINAAYASAIIRLKNNFGFEFSKLIKAYEEGRELRSYYNDIIKELKISRDFLGT